MVHDYKFIESDKLYGYEYPRAAHVTDAIVFRFDGDRLHLLLIERKNPPCQGALAFPGGFLNMDETTEKCCARELMEETGLSGLYMKQVGTVSTLDRDPRGRVLSTVYYALCPNKADVRAGDDAADAHWVPLDEVLHQVECTRPKTDGMIRMSEDDSVKPYLAFDHGQILPVAIQKLREDIHFRPIAFELLDKEFTMPQLRRLYEQILGVKFDDRNFKRKMEMSGVLVHTGKKEISHIHRCGWLYRFNPDAYVRMKKENPLETEF